MFNEKATVLIIDDDESMRDLLESILKTDYNIYKSWSAEEGLNIVKDKEVDIVLLDIMLMDGYGIDVLKKIKETSERTEVIMISVVKDLRTAVNAMKFGAFDYITKDFASEELKLIISKALDKRRLDQEVQCLRSEIEYRSINTYIAGLNPKMQEINEVIRRIAEMPSNVLIQGESGTGKEIVARRIHELGNKNGSFRPFISVNVASIPDDLLESTLFGHEKGSFTGAHKTHRGKFELAHGGTLFLDEISELKLELQAKLLRAIQEREIERVGGEHPIKINARIIAATNKNLMELVQKGKFREDLFYRLNVIPIYLPPLRERIEDTTEFVDFFLKKYSHNLSKKIIGITPRAMAALQSYNWPGNIRELENTIERMVALTSSGLLTEEDLPIELRFRSQQNGNVHLNDVLKDANHTFERGMIVKALEKEKWNQMKTAELLGIHRKTLEYKMKKLKIYDIIEERKKMIKSELATINTGR